MATKFVGVEQPRYPHIKTEENTYACNLSGKEPVSLFYCGVFEKMRVKEGLTYEACHAYKHA